MRYFLVAGERSGDLHGSRIVNSLRKSDSSAEFQGWGGDAMEKAGVQLKKHYRETATMGFLEVLQKLNHFRNLIKQCKKDIEAYNPDAVIFIDYGAFNLRVAPAVKKMNIPIYYFITPKVWAWNTKRANKLARLTDHRLVILPFEVGFFQQKGIKATYVGNPLTERISSFNKDVEFRNTQNLDERPVMALLPGSRQQEVNRLLPMMLQLVKEEPNFQWVMSGVNTIPSACYQPAIDAGIRIVWEDSYNLLAHAHTAVVASGTATLETALFGVPQIVVYKTSKLSAAIVRMVIKIKHVSLPNLIANRQVIPELLQHACTVPNIKKHFNILQTKKGRMAQLLGYEDIRDKLGELNTPQEVAYYIRRTIK